MILLLVAFAISLSLFPGSFNLTLFSLWLAGLVYNIPPMRLKDVPYMDVISESVNNPIRFMFGWFIILPKAFPYVPALYLTWICGAILMTAKRYDEFGVFGKRIEPYRHTFKVYTREKLAIALYFYCSLAVLLFIVISLSSRPKLLLSLPFVCLFLIWLAREVISGRSKARYVEKFVTSKKFILFSALLVDSIILSLSL